MEAFKKKLGAAKIASAAALVAALAAAMLALSCKTVPPAEVMTISRSLTGRPAMSAGDLADFFCRENPVEGREGALEMARLYVDEAAAEGINSDVAFAQMCLETGFLRFGGLVTRDMNNFCGLGSIGPGQEGERFGSARMGVRAHIQHLNAYGDTDDLANECVDPRFRFVSPRGKAPTVFELSGTWAVDKEYGKKLDAILSRMEASAGNWR